MKKLSLNLGILILRFGFSIGLMTHGYGKFLKVITGNFKFSDPIGIGVAPSLILAYGIGRMGCHLSGDGDWGIVNLNPKPELLNFLPDWMWSYNYPNNVISAGIPIEGCTGNFCMQLAQPVYPTPFYEIILSLLIFSLLWKLRKKISTPGLLFSIYLFLNGLERFFIEKIRVNTEYQILGGITQAEIISSMLMLTSIVLALHVTRKIIFFYK